ncbi:MAG: molybdopterin-dependent oxidoreductase [Chloroflexota bacterium]
MTDQLFQQQLRHVPTLSQDDWHLIIDGYVAQPLTLNYNTLTRHVSTNITAALMCSGHSPEVPMLGEADWEGVPLTHLLKAVKPRWLSKHIAFQSADGYTTSLPIAEANSAYVIHTMNGKPLPAEHGFPVRVLVPGLAGYKQPKWVTHITLREFPMEGLWERRGERTDGRMGPIATIQAGKQVYTVGETVMLSGVAYAGTEAIEKVVVSINGAPPTHVRFTGGVPMRTTSWNTTWQPSISGVYNIEVTVTSRPGDIEASTSIIVEVIA